LALPLNPTTIGGAVLLTSACEDHEGDATNPDIVVPGGPYRYDSRDQYHEQGHLGAELVCKALEDVGIPPARIHRMHFDHCPGHPTSAVCRFLRRLPPHAPDCVIYYCGPASKEGGWMLGWFDENGDLQQDLIEPESLLPEAGTEDGPPGNRLIISDAPGSAKMWLRPATRLSGVAAWAGPALPGGSGGALAGRPGADPSGGGRGVPGAAAERGAAATAGIQGPLLGTGACGCPGGPAALGASGIRGCCDSATDTRRCKQRASGARRPGVAVRVAPAASARHWG